MHQEEMHSGQLPADQEECHRGDSAIQTFQNCEKVDFCYLSHPVREFCQGSPATPVTTTSLVLQCLGPGVYGCTDWLGVPFADVLRQILGGSTSHPN